MPVPSNSHQMPSLRPSRSSAHSVDQKQPLWTCARIRSKRLINNITWIFFIYISTFDSINVPISRINSLLITRMCCVSDFIGLLYCNFPKISLMAELGFRSSLVSNLRLEPPDKGFQQIVVFLKSAESPIRLQSLKWPPTIATPIRDRSRWGCLIKFPLTKHDCKYYS